MSTWPTVRLGEVTESMKNGIYKPASAYAEDGYACLRMYNIGDGKLVWRDIKRMHLSKRELSEYRLLPGDLLVNRVNSRELVGKAAVIPEGIEPLVFESKNIRLRLVADKANPKFINYQLFLNGRRHFSTNAQQVVGMASINQKQLADFSVVLPSLPVQQEAVAEIEQQFSRLDEAGANLKRVRANLKRYKAAVLKAAVEGKLTEDWRKRHPNVEPASRLLERILAERRAKWNGRGKYKEPDTLDASGLPLLPNSWEWVSLDQLLLNITDGDHQPPPQTNSGVPFLVIGNVRSGKLEFEDSRFVSRQYADGVDVFRKPTRGDILYTLVGSFGIALRVDTDQEFCIQRHIGVFRSHKLSPTAYLVHALNSLFIFLQATKVATGTAQKTVPLAGLRRFAIPLAPQAEQQEIVYEVERRLSVIEELEAAVQANLTRANRLRQAILKTAFSGRLAVS